MKKWSIFFCVALVIALIPASLTFAEDKHDHDHDHAHDHKSEVVAKVNGKDILRKDVDFFAAPVIDRARAMGQAITPEFEAQLFDQWTDQLISRELLIQHAKSKKMVVSEEELQAGIDQAKQQGLAMSDAALKLVITEELMIAKVIDQTIVPTIVVDDKEVEEFYNQKKEIFKQQERVKASHILVKSEATDTPEKKKEQKAKIDEILKKAKAKDADFAELAKKHSEGPSGPNGGDLGYFTRGRMVPEFEKAAFEQEIGGVSNVVETQFGYHIVKVFDKKAERDLPFDEVKEDIRSNLKFEKSGQEVEKLVTALRDGAKIEMVK